MSVVKKKIIKGIMLVHRWTGFFLCLVFLIWFISGFVMMYKDFPYLQRSEVLQKLPRIGVNEPILPLHKLVPTYLADSVEGMTISKRTGQLVLDLQGANSLPYSVLGLSGEAFRLIDSSMALTLIAEFEGGDVSVDKVELVHELDQWTPRSRFEPYLPFFRISARDDAGTVYYVSAQNGTILQKLNTSDKVWAWAGAIPHWIYFRDLRIHNDAWRAVVIGLSLAGVVMCIAGITLGFIRYRRNRGLRFSPFKKSWFKWHHYLGFVFGTITFTWVLSGLLSMNPWQWSPRATLLPEERAIWDGGSFSFRAFEAMDLKASMDSLSVMGALKEVHFRMFDGKAILQGEYADRKSVLAWMDDSALMMCEKLGEDHIREKLSGLYPGHHIMVEQLTEYDAYYVDKRAKKPLPVYKAVVDDVHHTMLYIDAHTGEVLKKYLPLNRANRWLYNGLHSFDLPFLFKNRPLWDVLLIVLLIGGSVLSITGVVLTYRKGVRKARR